ncbi:type VI secretion system Vgr family protein [Pedobacter lusitanus]|uniref:type VI secretion system Vgr family protein n=1 Tax=Pedobacter lusitanus TaxID=1503925 RepID=UPI0009E37825|nr:phage baseplate assembly protein V [Pedobacter lusitanus]
MVNKLIVDISIEQVAITHFSRFTLDQRFNEHHTFELRINHDQVEETGGITLAKSKDFIGKSITIQFARLGDTGTIFTGIITKVEIAQTHGFRGDIVITGYSPDILLNRGPDLGSYLNKDLKSILQQATNDTPQNDLDFQISPAYSAAIDYIIQYKESDFDFINRLSAEYHEWFYYDGRVLHFGKPDKQEEVALIYGRDLQSLQYGMQIAPLNYKKFAYHSQQDELLSAQPSAASSTFSDVSHAISASNDVFSKRFNQPLSVRVNSQREIDTFVNDEHKALVSGLVSISGRGDNAKVGIGKTVNISTSMHNGLDFQVEDFGKFIVTAIHHEIDGVGHYHHTFDGVAADSEKLQVKQFQKPFADMQLADVVDNNDPQGHGRIKVKFKWACQVNDPTEWLRVMTPDAGSSDKVSKNRGFVFIPEKGDQVVVAFEEGNIARPIVMGSVFHGKSGTGGSASNNSKSLTSKSGHTVQLNDGGGITIKDKTGGNHIVVDGQNKVTVTSSQTVVLTNGTAAITLEQDKITIHASEIEIAKKGGKSAKIDINGDTTNINTTDMIITSTNNKINGTKNTMSGENHITGGDTRIDKGDVFIN